MVTGKPLDLKNNPTYRATPQPQLINIPKMLFVMVDGHGAPESDAGAETEFQKAMQSIFGIIYGIKFWDKQHTPPLGYAKFTMPPIEGLWWTKSGKDFDTKKPADWAWTLLMRVPEFVTPAFFQEVVTELVAKKKDEAYRNVRLEAFEEGDCVQILHIGPYDQEAPTIAAMHAFAAAEGRPLRGKHHELYFGDPRRTAPEKLKTILRRPVT